MASAKRIAVFGSTGSIGCSTLEVVAADPASYQIVALSAHGSLEKLHEQALLFHPQWVVVTDPQQARKAQKLQWPKGCQLLVGSEALERVASDDDVDLVVAAIVGIAGLASTWAALAAGKVVALANKETLVAAGPLVRSTFGKPSTEGAAPGLLPVDSEHSAIFQAMFQSPPGHIERIVLTASGGPFRTWSADALRQVTVEEALAHPTWRMGKKISVDSATMMNKALEVIEARWLFDLPAEKIGVVIHPQSVVHGLVEYVDGSILAQLSPPDMRTPIQFALDYPHRRPGIASRLDWTQAWQLEFFPPDFERFPALELGYRCAREGGTSGAVLNAANEAAVAGFLEGDLHFTEIVPACRSVLDSHNYEANPSLEQIMKLDRWARQEVQTWVYV
jgi:1-deoxy-D-xylulose-5-phosphate reductoisomerase